MSRRDRTRRSVRIQRLVDMAAAEESRLAQAFGKLNAELESRRSQLGELNAFRQTYSSASARQSGANSAHWKDYQNFRSRLDQAVSAQQQFVRDSEQGVDAARERWLHQRQRLESLRKVLDRYRGEEQLRQMRSEQKQQDDLGQGNAAFGAEYEKPK
ncbi:MAG: flagellar export protein FliJ [Pseudomonadota bacterium]